MKKQNYLRVYVTVRHSGPGAEKQPGGLCLD